MGNAPSQSNLIAPLKALLRNKGIKVSRSTIAEFLGSIDFFAPWFAHTGQITLSCWEKLGQDLRRTAEDPKEPDLNPMVIPLWDLVRACLREEGSTRTSDPALAAARDTFEEVRSQKSESAQDLIEFKEIGCQTSLAAPDSESGASSSDAEGEGDSPHKSPPPLYSRLRRRLRAADAAPAAPPGGYPLDYQSEIIAPPGGSTFDVRQPTQAPPAPPWPPAAPLVATAPPVTGRQFHRQAWKQLKADAPGSAHAYPVLGLGTREVRYAPLDMAVLKSLKQAVSDYGATAPFTISLLESVGQEVLTPSDWTQLARACLSPGTFLLWQSMNAECCHDQADENAEDGNPAWNADMLLGRGPHQADQTQYPRQVYRQISECARRAWRQAATSGGSSSHLTKIVQGLTEPFADFVARILEAASRIFPSDADVKPLIKQIIYEQANSECKGILRQHRNKSVDSWLKYCRDAGGPLTNAGLAAMLATYNSTQKQGGGQSQGRPRPTISSGLCFQCHQPGHRKRDCPAFASGHSPAHSTSAELCRRCRKGPHKAEDCRSAFDADGNPLTGNRQGTKNGQRGLPAPARGPQVNAYTSVPPPPLLPYPQPPQAAPPVAPQAWTSVPPPHSS